MNIRNYGANCNTITNFWTIQQQNDVTTYSSTTFAAALRRKCYHGNNANIHMQATAPRPAAASSAACACRYASPIAPAPTETTTAGKRHKNQATRLTRVHPSNYLGRGNTCMVAKNSGNAHNFHSPF
jgi:hypothetical protein